MTAHKLTPYAILSAQSLGKSCSCGTTASVVLKLHHKLLIRLHTIVDLMGKLFPFNESYCHDIIQRRNYKNKNNSINEFS